MSLLDASRPEPWDRSLPVSDVELESFGIHPDPSSVGALDDESDLLALEEEEDLGLLDEQDEDEDEDAEEDDEDEEDEEEEEEDAFFRMGENGGLDFDEEEF